MIPIPAWLASTYITVVECAVGRADKLHFEVSDKIKSRYKPQQRAQQNECPQQRAQQESPWDHLNYLKLTGSDANMTK